MSYSFKPSRQCFEDAAQSTAAAAINGHTSPAAPRLLTIKSDIAEHFSPFFMEDPTPATVVVIDDRSGSGAVELRGTLWEPMTAIALVPTPDMTSADVERWKGVLSDLTGHRLALINDLNTAKAQRSTVALASTLGDAEAIRETETLRRKAAEILLKIEDVESAIQQAEQELQFALAEDQAANKIASENEAKELCQRRFDLAGQLDRAFVALNTLAEEYETCGRELSRYSAVTGITSNIIGNALKVHGAVLNFAPAVAKILDVPRAPGGRLLTTPERRKTLEEAERQSFARFLAND